jgi:hypothetical protein
VTDSVSVAEGETASDDYTVTTVSAGTVHIIGTIHGTSFTQNSSDLVVSAPALLSISPTATEHTDLSPATWMSSGLEITVTLTGKVWAQTDITVDASGLQASDVDLASVTDANTPHILAQAASATFTVGAAAGTGGDAFSILVTPGSLAQQTIGETLSMPPHKVAFVTSTMINGAYFNGDPAIADSYCQTRAEAGTGPNKPPVGTYKAFVSFTGINAKDRIVDSAYTLADATPVASSMADLLDGTILHAINMDENGATVAMDGVWTGTGSNGTLYGSDTSVYQCNNWTSNDGEILGTAGAPNATDSTWARSIPAGGEGFWCSDNKAVYCFQQ